MATKTQIKELAQEELMHGIARTLGYCLEDQGLTDKLAEMGVDQDLFRNVMRAQADRLAKLFDYEEAWTA